VIDITCASALGRVFLDQVLTLYQTKSGVWEMFLPPFPLRQAQLAVGLDAIAGKPPR
jgi:hypothetical protein